ncbi:hypothetical protein Pint_22668 [Pistacia integerrima]|uniref:Uncharacterized protein n=1 Tax=Pistacia integerrima TaxID=434235 RepID=A0ACC0YMZ6_9ROSI|nr:hypothetical protein Pint_22668 [Pistacia integerrima]
MALQIQVMTSIISSHHFKWSLGIGNHLCKGRFHKITYLPSKKLTSFHNQNLCGNYNCVRRCRPIFASAVDDEKEPDDSGDDMSEKELPKGKVDGVNSEVLRENLERIVGVDDSAFSGMDLATLIRNKYGRSYDVQLIKKVGLTYNTESIGVTFHSILELKIEASEEFMGKNLLALNVMWKYMEQRSFPLTEEEYILRLDDVANTLKCWGAVSHIRNSLAKLKERPRIGKAVSIFIDMDESGGRANEWIYK